MIKKLLQGVLISIITTTYISAQTEISDDKVVSSIKNGLSSTKELLKRVPIDYINSRDDTLLHYAARFGKRDVVEYLVRQKILISRKGGLFDGTALGEAIYYGHLGIARYLIESGSKLNVRNKYGDTPLHIAAKKGYLDIVKLLVKNGASKNIANKEGKTPYDIVPDLSWDSRKNLLKTLSIEKGKKINRVGDDNYAERAHIRMQERQEHLKKMIKTKNNVSFDKLNKSHIDSSSRVGMDIEIR